MHFQSPLELVNYARENSPFYKNLYFELVENFNWADIPLVEQEHFWLANGLEDNQLLTGKSEGAIFFKSGGTTGNPKFSIFTNSEWKSFCQAFGEGMGEANLSFGDRVANLFYGGELYASFLFIHESIQNCGVNVTQFPIAGNSSPEDVAKYCNDFQINVLCGVPTTFLLLAHYCIKEKITLPLSKLLYGGEALFEDQLDVLKSAFPNIEIHSVGYASVDGGLLGKRALDCKGSEHRVFKNLVVMEILNDSGEIVENNKEEGKLYLTNLTRRLMPIIRYPVGDKARWIEVGEKFEILGRTDEGARIGPVTITREDIIEVFKNLDILKDIVQFQMVLEHSEGKDFLRICIVSDCSDLKKENNIESEFYKVRKMYKDSIEKGVVSELCISFVKDEHIERNARTGKLIHVLDKRKREFSS